MVVIGCICLLLTAVAAEARDKGGVLRASQLMGMNVEGTDGKKLGDVKDLVIDPDDGSIEYIVLDFGGVLGIGTKYFAIPWEAVDQTADKKKLMIDVAKKDLKTAPGFDKSNWPELSDHKERVVIYEFYDIPVPAETPTDPPTQKKKSVH